MCVFYLEMRILLELNFTDFQTFLPKEYIVYGRNFVVSNDSF